MRRGSAGHCASMGTVTASPSPHLPTDRRHRRVGHAGRRRQGQGPEGGGRGRHRLRRRRARLPDARSTSSRRPSPPAGTRRTTATRPAGGLPELREAIAVKTKRDSGLRLRGRPGAGHQRRQARRLQHVRRAARPRRRGHRARRRTGRRTPRRSPSPGACRSWSPTDEASRLPGHRRPARGRPAPPRTKVLLFVSPGQPDRRRLPARARSRPSAGGRSSTASGSSPTRSTSTSSTATNEFTSMPVARARAGRHLRRPERRGQDLRHDRLAGRLDDRPEGRHRRRRPTSSPTPRRTWPTSRSAPRWPP